MKSAAKPRLSRKAERAHVAAKLQPVNDELALLRAHESDLRRDNENLADALAEAALLLDRCVPGRFRDRELAPLIRGFAMLAGADACARAEARALPTLGTPSSAMGSACNTAPPSMYAETHAGCSFVAGHAGDHLWKSNAFDVTGRHEPSLAATDTGWQAATHPCRECKSIACASERAVEPHTPVLIARHGDTANAVGIVYRWARWNHDYSTGYEVLRMDEHNTPVRSDLTRCQFVVMGDEDKERHFDQLNMTAKRGRYGWTGQSNTTRNNEGG